MKQDAWILQHSAPAPLGDEEAVRSPLAAATVMMVDDDALMTDLIRVHLEEEGYTRFLVTNDPHEALPLLHRHRPDLLLLDLMMPGLSGFDILSQVRTERALRYTPVIVLTAASGAEARLRALSLGATDFLAKPVDPSELVLRVRNTLAFSAYLERSLNYDTVTGLPNRRLLEQRLNAHLRRDAPSPVGLLNVTVEECRRIRDTLGGAAADRLLRAIAERLLRAVRSGDTPSFLQPEAGPTSGVVRLDSDTFAVMLAGVRRAEDAETVARRLLRDLEPPILLDHHEIALSASVGIAVSPADGNSSDALIKAADQARSQAQASGGGRYEFFAPSLNARHHERLTLGAELRRAAERGELRLHYQPKVEIATRRVVGAEALIRWQHPTRGLLPPGQFIPLAEELGLIRGIGDWVIYRACQDLVRWTAASGKPLRVAVNVSQPQFAGGHVAWVLRGALAASGLDPRQLMVELTESMLMSDARGALDLMREIKQLGVSLSLDDFGTGYSSLGYLKRFPIDELKIDRSFVVDLPGRKQDLAIVGTVIALGHNLGMKVVAEGVETEGQLEALRALDCDIFQGYLYSRPLPEPEFAATL